jgi:diacylglycerol kinase (ATP)
VLNGPPIRVTAKSKPATDTKLRDNPAMPEQAPLSASVPPLGIAPGHADPVGDAVNPQKQRKGLSRVWHATGYSIAGLRAGWHETAFRQEALASILLIPSAFWLGQNWVESVLLAGTVVLVMIVELLNTGIETAIDRIGPEWHDLSKRAKDMGSAAVLLSLVLCAATWLLALTHRFAA